MNRSGGGRGFVLSRADGQVKTIVDHVDGGREGGGGRVLVDRIGKGREKVALDVAFERARAVEGVVAGTGEVRDGGGRSIKAEIALPHAVAAGDQANLAGGDL